MRHPNQILRTALAGCAVLGLIACGAEGSASSSAGASPAAASGTPTATTTATPAPTATDAPTSPSSTPEPAPTLAPEAQRTPWLPYGRWATVTADALRVRYFLPGDIDDLDSVVTSVNAGETLFVVGPGVVGAHGYDWYEVAHGAAVGADGYVHAVGSGLIAGATSEGDEQFLAWRDVGCPVAPVDAVTLGGLTSWTLAHCDTGPLVGLEGMLNQPIHGPITPFSHEPDWLWFAPWFLTEPDEAGYAFSWNGWSIGLYFPPTVDRTALRRGDLVRIDGHLNDPAASECRVIGRGEEGGPEPTDDQQQAFRLGCSVSFVVDAIEVTGHVDLAER